MFDSYCAVCHGKAGKGDGPAAPAMKTPPSDLTGLTQKNSGKYPAAHLAAVIRGQAETAAHGNKDMPVWGPLFSSISQGHEGQVQQRITNLVRISRLCRPSKNQLAVVDPFNHEGHEVSRGNLWGFVSGDWRVWPNLSF